MARTEKVQLSVLTAFTATGLLLSINNNLGAFVIITAVYVLATMMIKRRSKQH